MPVDRGKPRLFRRATEWKKGMENFFHGQLGVAGVVPLFTVDPPWSFFMTVSRPPLALYWSSKGHYAPFFAVRKEWAASEWRKGEKGR